jgi:hypothetical protein
MSLNEVKQKIVQLAHEFTQKYGEEVFEIHADELIAYISSEFDYENWLIFKHNEIEMLKLFVQTIKEDLSKS